MHRKAIITIETSNDDSLSTPAHIKIDWEPDAPDNFRTSIVAIAVANMLGSAGLALQRVDGVDLDSFTGGRLQ